MCLLLIGIDAHPVYNLIIAANRDEFYNRPTLSAGFWIEAPLILAGKDLKEGGTWMGITKNGRFAALTNYRDIPAIKENAPSRGHLVSDFLMNDNSVNDYLDTVSAKGDVYNGYNLILGDFQQLYYYSNINMQVIKLETGIYGLSNHLIDTDWFKVRESKKAFNEILGKEVLNLNSFFSLLTDQRNADKNDLPDTGVGKEFEKILSPAFITSPVYGTRCSTLILVDREKHVTFIERTYKQSPVVFDEKEYEFKIDL